MKMKKRFFGILLSFVMVLGLMPGMSLTAYADDDPPYAQYKNTTTVIKFDEKDWYLINYDTSTVTLLAKGCVGASKYNDGVSFVEYSNNPTVKTAVDDYYT
jgi:hypothetical protein